MRRIIASVLLVFALINSQAFAVPCLPETSAHGYVCTSGGCQECDEITSHCSEATEDRSWLAAVGDWLADLWRWVGEWPTAGEPVPSPAPETPPEGTPEPLGPGFTPAPDPGTPEATVVPLPVPGIGGEGWFCTRCDDFGDG